MSCKYCGIDKFINQNICKLCKIFNDFQYTDLCLVMLVKSKLDQYTICKNTIDFFLKNKVFPYPSDIDNKAKVINYPIYKYMLVRNYLTDKEKKKLSKYKVFFTDSTLSFTSQFNKIQKINLDYNTVKKHPLKHSIENILDTSFSKFVGNVIV